MTLFVWHSTAIKNYGSGTVIVSAESVDVARTLVLDNFDSWLKENREWLVNEWADEGDKAEVDKYRAELMIDIQQDPITPASGVWFVNGSE